MCGVQTNLETCCLLVHKGHEDSVDQQAADDRSCAWLEAADGLLELAAAFQRAHVHAGRVCWPHSAHVPGHRVDHDAPGRGAVHCRSLARQSGTEQRNAHERLMAEHLVGGVLGLPAPSSGAAVIARQQQRQNTFFAKLKEPGAADVVRDVNAFLKQFVARWPTLVGMQQQAECIHSFISATHERLVTSHPLWKGCTAEEATDILEGLERLITIKLYKLFAS